MSSRRPDDSDTHEMAYLDSDRERERQRSLALMASVGTLMVALRRGGFSGALLGAFSGLLAYRASTGRGLKGTGTDLARRVERTLTGHRAGPLELSASVMVRAEPDKLYAFWRDFSRLPEIMQSITAVETTADGHTRWHAITPTGQTLQWDTEIIEDVPDQRIAWQSLEGADVPQRGEIRFVPGPPERGTRVELDLRYTLPHGLLSAAPLSFVNALSRETVREDLRRFKQAMETGEVPTAAVHAEHHDASERPS
ncbi:SRPBCC family protein [Salinisphaera sp. T31B1]|uniref:SRPBCC family protein n=1 Tax=Salinisphaera sp. T31B1 TaxID=727963 RepID=UPI00333E71BA